MNKPSIVERYQAVAMRIWNLFDKDPLPQDDPAHTWVERMESLVDKGLIVAKVTTEQKERMKTRNDCFLRRHHDDEIIDEVAIHCVPRFKESGLSGSEWRVSYVTQLKRKGHVMYQRTYNHMRAAAAHLAWLMLTWTELSDDDLSGWLEHLKHEDEFCSQVGCSAQATTFHQLKRTTAPSGDFIDLNLNYFRGFCQDHSTRGTGDLEDADINYEPLG